MGKLRVLAFDARNVHDLLVLTFFGCCWSIVFAFKNLVNHTIFKIKQYKCIGRVFSSFRLGDLVYTRNKLKLLSDSCISEANITIGCPS